MRIHPTHRAMKNSARSEGIVLVVVMWVTIALTGMVLVLAQTMRTEGKRSANYLSLQRAWAVEAGAIEYVLAKAGTLKGRMPDIGEVNCSGVQIGDGAFWIIRPTLDEDSTQIYGIVDEASKLNLNIATEEMMSKIEVMTQGVPASIIDWRDEDSEITSDGAESEYYLALQEPYECKNSRLETLGELMMIKDVTRDLLYGEDINRNGILDDNENDAEETEPADNRDGNLDRGIYDLCTVYSVENVDSGLVNVNDPGQDGKLYPLLVEATNKERAVEILTTTRQKRPYASMMDYFFKSKMTSDEFGALDGKITVANGKRTVGLINVNTASEKVLACLPGLEQADAASLIAGRPEEQTKGVAWVTSVLSEEKAVGIGPYITGRCSVYSADIVSVSGDGRSFKRCRVIINAQKTPAKIVFKRDLTGLGWPLDPEILDRLRDGEYIEEVLETTAEEVQ